MLSVRMSFRGQELVNKMKKKNQYKSGFEKCLLYRQMEPLIIKITSPGGDKGPFKCKSGFERWYFLQRVQTPN